MKSILESAINEGYFVLSDMLQKIRFCWVRGEITDAERQWLEDFARQRANSDFDQGTSVVEKLQELDGRIRTLEQKIAEIGTEEPTEPSEEKAPDYVEGKWYYRGDKATYNGKEYECIAPEGQVCVWSPDAYPTYWKEV